MDPGRRDAVNEHAHTTRGGARPTWKEARTFGDILRRRAGAQAQEPAFTFLSADPRGDVTLTYAELNGRARAIAQELEARGLSGQRVLIALPGGPSYVASLFGCFYAGAIAVPVPAPLFEAHRGPGLLAAIAQDSGAAAALVGGQGPAEGQRLTIEGLAGHIDLIAVEALGPGAPADWMPPPVDSRTLAFLHYTAGSAGAPKGVRVTHANLLDNAEALRRGLGHTASDKLLSWLPTHQGMGLMEGVLQPLYAGVHSVLMTPQDFFQRPARWLEAVSAHGATISGAPDFAYELCVRTVTEEERARLDLSHWRVAFTSGEQVRAETLERFAERFGPRGFEAQAFRPVYGLAECTWLVSSGRAEGGPTVRGVAVDALAQQRITERPGAATRLVSCGPTSVQVIIVHPTTRAPRADQEIGEIWLSGLSVADGYWGRVGKTEEAFRGRLASTAAGLRAFLRTGDLGACVGGELYVTSRARDVILWEGQDLRLHDLEFDAEASHPGLVPGGCAAFAFKRGREERLAVVAEVFSSDQAAWAEIAAAIRQSVSVRHGVTPAELLLVRAYSLPRSAVGHVSRMAVQAAHRAGELESLLSDASEQAIAGAATVESSPAPVPVVEAPKGQPLPEEALPAERVPLTPAMYAVHDPARGLQDRAGVSRVFDLPEGTKPFHIEEAVHAVWVAHETLRLRYPRRVPGEAGPRLAHLVSEKAPAPLTRLELGVRADEECWLEVERTARKLAVEVGGCAGPLAMFAWCDRGEGRAPWLLVVCHPALMDESSWRILAMDLADACEQARTRGRVRLTPQSGSLTRWARQLISEVQLPRLAPEARVHWLARAGLARAERPFLTGSLEARAPGALAVVDASALQRAAGLFEVSREALLVAGSALALGLHAQRATVRVSLAQSARSTSRYTEDASRMLGNLHYMFPVVLPIEPETTVGELARHAHLELSQAPLGGLAYEGLRAYGLDGALADALMALPVPDFSLHLEDEGAPSSRGMLRTLAVFDDGPWPGPHATTLRVEARLSAERAQLMWHGATSDGGLLSALAKLTEQTLGALCAQADSARGTTPARGATSTAQRSR